MQQSVPYKRLSISSFLSQFSIVQFNLVLVFYLKSLSLDSAQIGIASSITPIVYLLGCLFFPYVMRSINGKKRVLASLLGMALSLVFVPITKSLWILYFLLVLYGLFQSLLWTNMETWITSTPDEKELNKLISSFNFSWSSSVGPANLVAGLLVPLSYYLAFYNSVLSLVVAFVIVLSSPYIEKKNEQGEEEQLVNKEPSILRYPSWAAIFAVYTGYSMLMVVFPQYGLDTLNFSSSLCGRLLFYRGIAVAFFFVVLSRVKWWQKGRWPIMLSSLCFSLLTLLFIIFKTKISLAFLFILYGAVFALSYNLSIFHSAQGDGNRHMRMVIHEVLITAGTTFGSFVGSYIYQYLSFNALVIMVAIIGLVSFLAALFFPQKQIA